ncbi:MAG: hypothetical protein OZ921_00240 [Sorangiineae bacterium]|nr:hypothetical protein [Polyangiaceae bacterium]MEB2320913.1 hypothetical protein [Sorangiineae bacterium]
MGDVLTIVDFVEHVEALRALASRPPIESVDAEEPRATLPAAGVEPELGAGVEPPVVGTAYREIRQHGLSLGEVKRQIERDCIAQALSETAGNITRAALVLGMKRPRLSQLVKQYGLLPGVEEDGS